MFGRTLDPRMYRTKRLPKPGTVAIMSSLMLSQPCKQKRLIPLVLQYAAIFWQVLDPRTIRTRSFAEPGNVAGMSSITLSQPCTQCRTPSFEGGLSFSVLQQGVCMVYGPTFCHIRRIFKPQCCNPFCNNRAWKCDLTPSHSRSERR